MEKFNCTLNRILFQNAENGFAILEVAVSGNMEDEILKGTFYGLHEGMLLEVEGRWEVDSRYGRRFSVESWTEVLPKSVKAIERYLGSGLIPGIGKVLAGRIADAFKTKTFEVISKDPDRLLEVKGIRPRHIANIRAVWQKLEHQREALTFLQGVGLGMGMANKVFDHYVGDTVAAVRKNPYRLIDDIPGIGFKSADEIALQLGFDRNSLARCRNGLLYACTQLAGQGHVYALRSSLIDEAVRLLEVDEETVCRAYDEMIAGGELVLDGEAVYLPVYYHAECGVAQKLQELLSWPKDALSGKKTNEKKLLDSVRLQIKREKGFELDETQMEVLGRMLKSKAAVVTGGPGTGKTAVVMGLLKMYNSLGVKVLLAAPTGRAAKRMEEVSGMTAKTIHRLLEYNFASGFMRNAQNQLSGDVLIVDESSMIDILLMNDLLKAVPNPMRLVFVGDVDQLPSVGPGNVFRDMIDSGVVPVMRLTKIFRQAQSSRIVTNAQKINLGQFPDLSNGADSDFFFIESDDDQHARDTIVELVKTRLPKAYGVEPADIQVLTPMHKFAVGTRELNLALQEALNPSGSSLSGEDYKYRRGDRVMQVKNDANAGVFNGDIGTVLEADREEGLLTVDFDGLTVEYEKKQLVNLTLAYAVTIHKSQGSEFPVVVIPLLMQHYAMLQRNLLYTAVTRAKRLCIVIGSGKAVSRAIANNNVTRRNTRLKQRLQE